MLHDMEPSASEEIVIRKISALLRTQGELLLNGTAYLSLSAKGVAILNASFEWITETDLEVSFEATPTNTTHIPLISEIQTLYDFTQKLLKLKISHKQISLQSPLNLSPFRSLQHLELKNVPLHFIYGLTKIRPHLQSLTCQRCLSQLKAVLETCGGDRSEASLSWNKLTALHLRYNSLRGVDSSLRLVPMLTALDLSHNIIADTRDTLEYLTELKALNLSFNRLPSVPSVALSCRPRLRVLLLKYNRITTLQGLEELTCLCELDLSGNLLASHTLLSPLQGLTHLRQLRLETNPIGYHSSHRRLTVEQLHAFCLRQITLDGKRLSKKEIRNHAKDTRLLIGLPRPALVVSDSEMDQSAQFYKDFFVTSPVTSQSEAEVRVVVPDRRKKTRTRRARTADITDADQEEARSANSLSAGSFSEDHSKVKANIEHLRRELGSDWLTGLQHVTASTEQNGNVAQGADRPKPDLTALVQNGYQSESTNETIQKQFNNSDGSSLNHNKEPDKRTKPTSKDEKSKNSLQSNAKSNFVDQQTKRDLEKSLNINGTSETMNDRHSPVRENGGGSRTNPGIAEDLVKDSALGLQNTKSKPSTDITAEIEHRKSGKRNGLDGPDGKFPKRNSREKADPFSDKTSEHNRSNYDGGRKSTTSSDNDRQKPSTPSFWHSVSTSGSDASTVDYGPESEPFIVSSVETPGEEYIVSVSERYLLAKDINGDVTEELDLLSLLTVSTNQMSLPGLGGDVMHCVRLTFDYVNRSKRERHLGMEDETACQALLELLEPIAKANVEKIRQKNILQCLKCDQEFPHPEPQRSGIGGVARIGSRGRNMNQLPKNVVEALAPVPPACPHCGSELVIEAAPQVQAGNGNSDYTTPVGSVTTSLTTMVSDTLTSLLTSSPLATSSAVPTPLRHNEREATPTKAGAGRKLSIDANSCDVISLGGENSSYRSCNTELATSFRSIKDAVLATSNFQNGGLVLQTTIEEKRRDHRKWISSAEEGLEEAQNTSKEAHNTSVFTKEVENTSLFSEEAQTRPCESTRGLRSSGSDIIVLKSPLISKITVGDNTRTDNSSSNGDTMRNIESSVSCKLAISSHDSSHKCERYIYSTQSIGILPSNSSQLEHSKHRVETFDDVDSNLDSNQSIDSTNITSDNVSQTLHAFNLSHVIEHELSQSKTRPVPREVGEGEAVDPQGLFKRRQSSDILVLSEGESNVQSETETVENETETVGNSQGAITTVYGSLSSSAVSSMVDYMRSSIYDSTASVEKEETEDSIPRVVDLLPESSMTTDDGVMLVGSELDHRLKLHLMMHVFGCDTEEFQLLLRCGVVQFTVGVEQRGLVVASNSHLYIFTIMGPESLDDVPSWLSVLHAQPLTRVRSVQASLGHQGFRIEFGLPATCFDVLVRDEIHCKTFIAQLSALLQDTALSANSQLRAISRPSPKATQAVLTHVIQAARKEGTGEDEDEEEDERAVLAFIKAFWRKSESNENEDVCVVVSDSHLCLAHEDYQAVAPRDSIRSDDAGTRSEQEESIIDENEEAGARDGQFSLLLGVDVTDITRLELPLSNPLQLTIVYSQTDSAEPVTLHLETGSDWSRRSLVTAISQAYTGQLEVQLDIVTTQ